MPLAEILVLVLAGIGAGLSGSIAGLASLVSYPALLSVGLPPVTANVTNTVALVFSSVGAVAGSRPELQGQGVLVRRLAGTAVAGGLAGGALLLLTPSDAFELAVPVLIGGASLAVLLPRPLATTGGRPRTSPPLAGVFAVGVYGGYFGAAAGVLLLALLLRTTTDSLPRSNAMKNVVLGLANGVAALVFVLAGPVEWRYVAPLAVGLLVGARTGPVVVRRTDVRVLRVAIAVAGLAVAARLGLDAYG